MRWSTVIATCGSVALALACQNRPTPKPTQASCAERTPEPAQARYRFAIDPPADATLSAAIEELEARAAAPTATPFDLADLAELYHRRGQRDGNPDDDRRSEAMARRSLAILPSHNGAALTLAKLASARHDFREAIALANAQLAHDGGAATQIVLAGAYLAIGELTSATAAAEAAVERTPSSAAYAMRALTMQAQGRDAETEFDFARAIAVETHGDAREAARVRTLWGRFLLRRGDLPGAAPLFDEALRIVPGYPLAVGQRAELALRQGRLDEARAGYEQAFASSRQVRYLMDLARAQELAGDADSAARSRGQVEAMIRAELADRGVGHQLELVEVLIDRGGASELAEAIALSTEELQRRPGADTRFQLARALARSGQSAEAITQVHAALASGIRDARLYELAARLERGPRAALYAGEAAALDPGGSGWRTLGMP